MNLYAVRIFVQDWDGACDFYRDVLGLPERFRNADSGWAEYDLGGPCFGIERIDAADAESRALVGRMLGVSLRVDDIDATCESLRGRGVDFVAPPEKQPWGGYLAHFRDPEGNVLTLLG
jgi:catechol 2,3-dioxygenase-like lactoylglutathione lyase family enzyme